MNKAAIATVIVFALGFVTFLTSVALSFFVSGGGVFALGGLGSALMAMCPLAGMFVE